MQTTGEGDRSCPELPRGDGGSGQKGGQREENDFGRVASRDTSAAHEQPDPARSRELDPEKPGLTQAEQGDDGCQERDDEPPAGDLETLLEPKES